MTGTKFRSVLVANRGEIAIRIMRTLRRLGIRSVAVYSDADSNALHVQIADSAIRLGPTPAAQSYLSIERLSDVIRVSGVDAVHPGYGFLSENARFARAVEAAGAVWVGPPPSAIEAMGDKVRAKATVAAAGVPVVPGSDGRGLSDGELGAAADEVGYPVLLKPSAGGGGKGMRVVASHDELSDALVSARREATAAFGDDTMLLERFVATPRHIEVQVLADRYGNVIHLGERECSLQRRHQKIVEEAPSPLLDESTRTAIGASAVEAARSCGYTGAGTVEFIVSADAPQDFFFMEMNTRLQVEHPVTELVTGLDLVELQLRIATGEKLPLTQAEVRHSGHAVEARVYAEDPDHGFLPTGGRVVLLSEPAGEHIRVDSGIAVGTDVGSAYDPMLSKVIAWGADRDMAMQRLDFALESTTILGVTTNVAFLRELLQEPQVLAGELDTGLVERFAATRHGEQVPLEVYVAAALRVAARESVSTDPWGSSDGWRVGEPAWSTWRFQAEHEGPVTVRARTAGEAFEVSVGGELPESWSVRCTDATIEVRSAHTSMTYRTAAVAGTRWLGSAGRTWALHELESFPRRQRDAGAAAGGAVRSPMPGTVLDVRVAVGDSVRAGQPLAVVEAMKMEHVVTAPVDGRVESVPAKAGAQVALDEVLVVVNVQLPDELSPRSP